MKYTGGPGYLNTGPILLYYNLPWQLWEECQTNNFEEQQNCWPLTGVLRFPDSEMV